MHKILVIDDEGDIRIAIMRVLSREGYQVILSESAENAIKFIKAVNNFSLVISDITLKGLTGIDLVKFISDENLNLPVILITGNPNLGTAESALRYGAFDYISKPVERTQLLSVVKNAVNSKIKKDHASAKIEESELLEKVLRTENLDLNRQNAAILNATSDAVITIESGRKILSVNFATLGMFEYTKVTDLIGEPLDILFNSEKMEKYLDKAVSIISKNFDSQAIQLPDVTFRKSDDTTFIADVAICSYTIDDATYFTGVIRDVTQKKIMVNQLIDSERRAFLSMVAASIGHEINNSLTAIQGFVEMATQENADLALKDRALQITLNQIQKLNTLTKNLLLLGKSSKISTEIAENIELNDNISNILEIFCQTAKLKYCHIDWSPSKEKIIIHLNADQFNILLSNLLINAADATEGHGNIKISIQVIEADILLSIADNGCGMTQDTMNHIFEPYFTTKELGKGTGLGMYVVKQIADTFGIKIDINSKLNVGSIFTLVFTSRSNL